MRNISQQKKRNLPKKRIESEITMAIMKNRKEIKMAERGNRSISKTWACLREETIFFWFLSIKFNEFLQVSTQTKTNVFYWESHITDIEFQSCKQ
jgi:hypothetical protein